MLSLIRILMVVGCFMLLGTQGVHGEEMGAGTLTLKAPKRGDVEFAHLLHQEILTDCMVCHERFPKAPGSIDKLKVDGSLKNREVMTICRNCHRAKKAAGEKAGPITCSACHHKK